MVTPPSVRPFLAAGAVAIVAGGIAAALTGPTGWGRGSWVAAFLVLVAGVGQIGLGAGQAMLADDPPSRRLLGAQVGLLNGGALTVLAGALLSRPVLVSTGGVVLVGALVSFRRPWDGRRRRPSWSGRAYDALLLMLLVSTPVGVVLSWVRA